MQALDSMIGLVDEWLQDYSGFELPDRNATQAFLIPRERYNLLNFGKLLQPHSL